MLAHKYIQIGLHNCCYYFQQNIGRSLISKIKLFVSSFTPSQIWNADLSIWWNNILYPEFLLVVYNAIYVCLCEPRNVYACCMYADICKDKKSTPSLLNLELQAAKSWLAWVLWAEYRSSARPKSTLSHRTTCLGPDVPFFLLQLLLSGWIYCDFCVCVGG